MGTEALHAEIDRLAAAELSGDPAVLGAEICELHRAAERALAEASRRLAPFDGAQGYLDEGQATTKAWLRTQTTMSHGQAAAKQNVAAIEGELPLLFAAWRAGETTFDHVRQAEINLRKLPREIWDEVDAEITAKARVQTATEFGAWLRELAHSLGAEPKPRDETRHESRRLSLSCGFDGMSNLVGLLTPEVAEKLQSALSATSRPDAEGELRLKNQRTADALEALLDILLASGRLPGEGAEKPQLRIGIDLDQISEDAQRDEERRTAPVDWWALTDEERVARIRQGLAAADAASDPSSGCPRYYWTGGAGVSAARRLACDGVVLPIFTRNGAPIDVGRQYRMISSPMRALIEGRDRHCQWDGCAMAGRWCQVHNVKHWKDGGTTDRWNLVLLCEHHHREAHSGRWTIVLHAPGVISTRRRRTTDDPYYEIRLVAPPPSLTVTDKLRAAAARATTCSEA